MGPHRIGEVVSLHPGLFRMATSAAMYFKVPSDGDNSQRSTSSILKVGFVGTCLVLLSIMGIYSYSLPSSSAAGSSTSLLGLTPSSLRKPSAMAGQAMANQLPGASPWKELALAGIQGASRCDRDVSANAAGVKSVLARMNSHDKALVVKAQKAVAMKANDVLEGVGALDPLGFWDPLGISTNLPESAAGPARLLFYREVELKHGRICMLAALGFVVGEQFHPLFGGDIDVPSYIAFQQTPLQTFWVAVSAAIALPEVLFSIPTFNTPKDGDAYIDGRTFTMKSDRIPGDLGFDPLGLKPSDPNELRELQNKELNNGRLAMIGIAGMVAQELVTGEKLFN